MRVLVCGSRDWPDPEAIWLELSRLDRGTTIIHGAARGADDMAATIARSLGLEERAFPADWRGKGKRAGIIRNLQMLDERPDLVIAFQRNGSRGTQHTIDEARRRGIPVEVHTAGCRRTNGCDCAKCSYARHRRGFEGGQRLDWYDG